MRGSTGRPSPARAVAATTAATFASGSRSSANSPVAIVRTDRGVIDNADSTLRLAGELNLKDESLALVATSRPKDFSPLSLRTPITVRGTLAQPRIGVEGGRLVGKLGVAAALGAAVGAVRGPDPFDRLRQQGSRRSVCRCPTHQAAERECGYRHGVCAGGPLEVAQAPSAPCCRGGEGCRSAALAGPCRRAGEGARLAFRELSRSFGWPEMPTRREIRCQRLGQGRIEPSCSLRGPLSVDRFYYRPLSQPSAQP